MYDRSTLCLSLASMCINRHLHLNAHEVCFYVFLYEMESSTVMDAVKLSNHGHFLPCFPLFDHLSQCSAILERGCSYGCLSASCSSFQLAHLSSRGVSAHSLGLTSLPRTYFKAHLDQICLLHFPKEHSACAIVMANPNICVTNG